MDFGQRDSLEPELRVSADAINKSQLLHSYEDLAFVCAAAGPPRSAGVSESSAPSPGPGRPQFRNALESLLERCTEARAVCATEGSRRAFSDLLPGAGIAEVTGPSGSGKTSYCLSFANSSPGLTLYVDTSGSVSLARVLHRDRFILLRVFNCEELEQVIADFAERLSGDGDLPCFKGVRARSVATLVVDSLWPLCLLEPLQRRGYMLRLCVTLRHISWRHDIAVIVCNNDARWDAKAGLSGKILRSGSVKEQFRSRCYVHVSLEQRAPFGDGCAGAFGRAFLGDSDPSCDSLDHGPAQESLVAGSAVRRDMTICSGGDHGGRRLLFDITTHNLVAYSD